MWSAQKVSKILSNFPRDQRPDPLGYQITLAKVPFLDTEQDAIAKKPNIYKLSIHTKY
jgi:hypothetical protein